MQQASVRFLEAVRHSHDRVTEAWVWRNGELQHDEPLPLVGGSVEVDASSQVRRTLRISVSAIDPDGTVLEPRDVADLLAPFGTELEVHSGIRFPEGDRELVPVGVFRVDDVRRGGLLTDVDITCPDRTRAVQEARFVRPWITPPRTSVIAEIERLVLDVNPAWEVIDLTNATDLTSPMTWERDRWDAIMRLAAGVGAQVSFDPRGRLLIEDAVTEAKPDEITWTIAGGPAGVLGDASTGLSRDGVYNAVVATGNSDLDTPPVIGVAYQRSGPFAWGGPFGKVPRFYSSPLLKTTEQAQKAAATILSRSLAFARGVDVTCVANPALDADDVVRITLPDGGEYLRLVLKLTLPLRPDEPSMSVATRTPSDAELSGDLGSLD